MKPMARSMECCFAYKGTRYTVFVKFDKAGFARNTAFPRGYRKIVDQNFWYFISGKEGLYTDIIEPLGHRAREHDEEFQRQKDRVSNQFTREFMAEYCTEGVIDWKKLVEFNTGNLADESGSR